MKLGAPQPIALWWALYADELNGTVLDPNGSASPADLAANAAGLDLWKQIMNGNLQPGSFDICKFVNDKWDQTKNPNVPGALRGSRIPPRP